MNLVVSTDQEFENIHEVQVPDDITLSDFLDTCKTVFNDLSDILKTDLEVRVNGAVFIPEAYNLRLQIKLLGFRNSDLILVRKRTSDVTPSTSTEQNNLLSHLVKSMKDAAKSLTKPNLGYVANSSSQHHLPKTFLEALRREFDILLANSDSGHMRNLPDEIKEIVARKDFDAYVAKILTDQQKMNDPTSSEGQRLIEEQIRLKNIISARNYAIEHMPEAYIPVVMLYVRIKINGFTSKAFIDTGAQLSILSDLEAARCGLLDVIDRAYNVTVRGVAGEKECIGKIHACVLQIGENYYHSNFEVLCEQSTPLLIGLDFLRRHMCTVDLKNNCLLFGDSSSALFLSDAELVELQEI